MKFLFRALPLLCSFALVGCLEFGEVTQLKPDGGIDFTLRVQMPELPESAKADPKQKQMEEEVQETFRTFADSVRLTEAGEKNEYGKKIITLSASLDSLGKMEELYRGFEKKKRSQGKEAKREIDEIFGKNSVYRVRKTPQGTLLFTRDFTPSKAKPEKKKSKEDATSKEMEALMMNSMTFQFEFFSPTRIIRHNAAQAYGNNLRWTGSMGYVSTHPFHMEFEIESTPELEAALLKKK